MKDGKESVMDGGGEVEGVMEWMEGDEGLGTDWRKEKRVGEMYQWTGMSERWRERKIDGKIPD